MLEQGGSEAFLRVLAAMPNPRKAGREWKCCCPAHPDTRPSLYLAEGRAGDAVLTCRSNHCKIEDICAGLGLTVNDLFLKDKYGRPERRFEMMTGAVHVRGVDRNGDKTFRWENLNGHRPADFLWPMEELTSWEPGSTVFICEGETDTQALLNRGLQALGTMGASVVPTAAVLSRLASYQVVLWPDNDEAGLRHMQEIAKALTALSVRPAWVLWPEAPPKGGAADFTGSNDELLALVVRRSAWPETITAGDLLRKEFRPPRWAVPELLREGLIILGGRPKMGKSWLALGMGVDIARGGKVLRLIQCEGGEVLYLALEDGQKRIQGRLQLMLGDDPAPSRLQITDEWPKLGDEGGLLALEEWLKAHPGARAIFIDTFKRIRPAEDMRRRLYDLDYEALQPLHELALKYGVAIVVVFHTRKGESEDPVELISGTLGLSGVADEILVLKRERGQADASLFVTGRDVDERAMALKFHAVDAEVYGWEWLGNAEEFRLSKERQALLEVIRAVPGMKAAEVAGAVGKSVGSVRYLLFRMVHESQVRLRDGAYYPPVDVIDNTPNTPNALTPLLVEPLGGQTNTPNTPNTLTPVSAVSGTSTVSAVSAVSGRKCVDCGEPLGRGSGERCVECWRVWARRWDEDAPI